MEGDRNEPDQILGEDWMMPGYRRYTGAWEASAARAPHRAEGRGRRGRRARWSAVRELHEDGWVEYWLRPTDLRDGRESICIGRWPEKVETDELADALAIVDEHDDAPR